MEQIEKFRNKLSVFKKAVEGFKKSINIDTTSLSEDVDDAVKNGRIQKFEYCTELTWKIIKDYLYIFHNIDAKSPRESIKEFFLINKINREDYELLLNILDDRNKLSHIYREEYFLDIHNKLLIYQTVLDKVCKFLEHDSIKEL